MTTPNLTTTLVLVQIVESVTESSDDGRLGVAHVLAYTLATGQNVARL
jgi:hypothetical protein